MQAEHPHRVSRHAFRAAAVALAGLALTMASATTQAQTVRKCTIEGRVVFQASACPADHPAAAMPPKNVATEVPAPAKKKSLAEVLHDRDAADQSHGPIREFKSDGADVLRPRMGAV